MQADQLATSVVPASPEESADIIVAADNVSKWYGPLQVLKNVSLTVRRGETVVIIGPSGSGKTTFVRCINHLEKIQALRRLKWNGRRRAWRRWGRRAGR